MEFTDAFFTVDSEGDADSPELSSSAQDMSGTGGFDTEVFDADFDGRAECRVHHTDAGMTVARDRDEDGVIDSFTTIGRVGHYESWEIFRANDGSTRWNRTGEGEVFE